MNIEINKMTLLDLDNIKNNLTSDFDDFWSYNILKEELKYDNSTYIIAKLNNEIIGFAGIKIVIDKADIMNIVTKKIYRNQGVGGMLLKSLISLSKKLNLTSLSLEVNENNLTAIHLYKKFGFEILGTRKNYYQNQNAIIMTKTL